MPVWSIHGKQKQTKRTTTFFSFCNADSGILLCTDVAARGNKVVCVFNLFLNSIKIKHLFLLLVIEKKKTKDFKDLSWIVYTKAHLVKTQLF